jgi:hypothetical protein
MSLVVDELLTVPGHMNSPPVLGWNHFAQLLIFCVMFCTSLAINIIIRIKKTLEKTEGAIKNGQSRETGEIGYTKHKTKTIKQKTQHNMCLTPPYTNNHK